ncbi:MAG TPA: class I SAM-dependent methyltransferase [Jatrophihabitans sp.]|jgi:ubiquinone/menaquinone biosynthesis C-methylase UbiE|nr:class I SAM-dependent methyltransferase [Jatrophihabitans sp.]
MTPDSGSHPAWSEPALSTSEAQPPRMQHDAGRVASWHPQLIQRAADVALAAMPIPLRVLDVGCGDGHLLSELILRVPHADSYVGVDPLPDVISAADRAAEPRLCLVRAAAEALPFASASFDLVVATMSMAYWPDQRAGVRELARVATDNAKVIVVESSKRESSHPNRARTASEVSQLLTSAGLHVEDTDTLRRSPLLRPLARAFICSL